MPKCGLVAFPDLTNRSKEDASAGNLFLVHGVGGNLATFYPLVAKMHEVAAQFDLDPIRFYGLHASSADLPEMASLDTLVAHYVREITRVQPEGPYRIGGWSFGVTVASMIAQTLIARGDIVDGFVAIDAQAPRSYPDFAFFLKARGITDAATLYEGDKLHEALSLFGHQFGFPETGAEGLKDKLHAFLGYPAASSAKERDASNMVAVQNLFNAAVARPEPVKVAHALIIKASESVFDDHMDQWSRFLSGGSRAHHDVSGDHWSIMSDEKTAETMAFFGQRTLNKLNSTLMTKQTSKTGS